MPKDAMDNMKTGVSYIEPKLIDLQISEVPFQVNEAINTLRGNIQLSGYDL